MALSTVVSWLSNQDIRSPIDLKGVNTERLLDSAPGLEPAVVTFIAAIIEVLHLLIAVAPWPALFSRKRIALN